MKGRKKSEYEGKRITLFFHKEQVEYIDREAEKEGVKRSRYIQDRIFPPELRTLHKYGGSK